MFLYSFVPPGGPTSAGFGLGFGGATSPGVRALDESTFTTRVRLSRSLVPGTSGLPKSAVNGLPWVSVESDYWTGMLLSHEEDGMGRRGYPPEFRQRVLDLVAAGGRVGDIARDLGISDQTVYGWRRQARVDQGVEAGLTSVERAELTAARRRIRELESELAIHRKAAELLKEATSLKGGSRPLR
jgi:transposase-like protein